MAKSVSQLRAEAREYRLLAQGFGETVMRQTMENVAASCEALADKLEGAGLDAQWGKRSYGPVDTYSPLVI